MVVCFDKLITRFVIIKQDGEDPIYFLHDKEQVIRNARRT